MKKHTTILIALLLCVTVLCGCGSVATGGGQKGEAPVTAETVDANLRYFLGITDAEGNEKAALGDMGDRTPTSESERHAAELLYARYADTEAYPHFTATPLYDTEFDVRVSTTETRKSQNVEIRFMPGGEAHEKQVVIGTGYDNPFGTYNTVYDGQPSTGAFDNATGVATLMSCMDYVHANAEALAALPFDLVFVFFGCSGYNSAGANAYVSKQMTAAQHLTTVLMVNVGKLGGERMYLYADEVSTAHETFLRDVASNEGLTYYSLPKNMPLIEGTYIDNVYYTHFGMLGDHAAFTEWGIPTAYITSGYYGGFNLSDLEKSGEANLGGTERDTYENLRAERGAYAEQGSDTVTLLLRAATHTDFLSVMEKSKNEKTDYTFWTNPLWAYLIVLFIVIALCILLIVLVKHFEKKYPFVPIVRKMKIAVFGMEYENKTDGDIFVDIKRPKNPFDGY